MEVGPSHWGDNWCSYFSIYQSRFCSQPADMSALADECEISSAGTRDIITGRHSYFLTGEFYFS